MNAQGFGMAAQLGGTLLGGLGANAGIRQQQEQLGYNAQVARNLADQSRAAGLQNELNSRRRTGAIQGEQRAAVAESGFDPNSGTALQVQVDSARQAELDALQQRYEGTLRGNAYDTQAREFDYQADAIGSAAGGNILSTGLSMASQLLSSGGFGGAGGAGAAGGAGSGALSIGSGFMSGSTATSGVGAGGSLGSFASGTSSAGTAVSGGASSSGLGSGLAAAGPWAALAAAVIGNETYARNRGDRRSGGDYYKDLATGRVLSQDVDNRWSPMLFGKDDKWGFGHDMSFAADLGSFQFGKAWKDFQKGSIFSLFKNIF